MESTFGIIALASSIFLAISCLCLVGLNFNELYEADERLITFAVDSETSNVQLASTEIIRGYLISIFLLLFSTILSSFSHLLSTTQHKQTKICKSHFILKRIILYIILISFICGIILLILSVISLIENETPKWCIPGNSIEGNLITVTSPISVPIEYVYNDNTDTNLLISGNNEYFRTLNKYKNEEEEDGGGEEIDLNLPSKQFRGEFKRYPLIDASGRICYNVNDSIISFWKEALYKYAIPISLLLCFLIMFLSLYDTIDYHEKDKHHHNSKTLVSVNKQKQLNDIIVNDDDDHDDEDDRLVNPFYENDVPILKFLKVAKLSKSARASIILGGMTEGKRPPLRTAQDLAWDPCFCDLSIEEACDPTRLEHEFGIRGRDVHRLSVALSTARELRRWIELQSLGMDERLAYESYQYITKQSQHPSQHSQQSLKTSTDGGGRSRPGLNNQHNISNRSLGSSINNSSFNLNLGIGGGSKQGSRGRPPSPLDSLNHHKPSSFSSSHNGTIGGGGGGGGGGSHSMLSSASYYHNRMVIEKIVGIESLQNDLSDLLIQSQDMLSDEVIYQAFKDAGVMHPGERLRMVASLRNKTINSNSSNMNDKQGGGGGASGDNDSGNVGGFRSPLSNRASSTSPLFQTPFEAQRISSPGVSTHRNTPSPHTPPPTRNPPPPPSIQKHLKNHHMSNDVSNDQLTQSQPMFTQKIPESNLNPSHQTTYQTPIPNKNNKTSHIINDDDDGLKNDPPSNDFESFASPSMPLTPYERNNHVIMNNNNNYVNNDVNNIRNNDMNDEKKQVMDYNDAISNRPIIPPLDRSIATTYYCVKAHAGGKKTCKISWTPPPLPPHIHQHSHGMHEEEDDKNGTIGARMFCITSKSPDLLKASKTEFLLPPIPPAPTTPPPSLSTQEGKKNQNNISLKFVITPPLDSPTEGGEGNGNGGGTILEAIAEIYEIRNGGHAAVDLLEFAVHVSKPRK